MLLLNLLVTPVLFHLSSAKSSEFKVEAKTRDAAPFTCPLDDIARTGCTGVKDCLYPHPQDYNSYIKCVMNGPNGQKGVPTIQRCAPGLNWNQNTKECDALGKLTRSADLKRCPGGFLWNNDTKECERLRIWTRAVEDDGGHPYDFECPVDKIIESGCQDRNDCFFADPYSGCHYFYMCIPGSGRNSYTPHRYTCPSGLLYNDGTRSCDVPGLVTCMSTLAGSSKSVESSSSVLPKIRKGAGREGDGRQQVLRAKFECPTKESPACPKREDCAYPDPKDCGKYYVCEVNPDGWTRTAVPWDCPPGLWFNVELQRCNAPESLTCNA